MFLPDTLKSFLVKSNPPYLFKANLNHREKNLWNKMVRGNNSVIGFNFAMAGYLLVAPNYISKWDADKKFNISAIVHQFQLSYTQPPVIDNDFLIINYGGHPYQGGFYYNTIRSQGATVLQSSLYCLAQSFLWEYFWEAGFEQPSIQDLFTTPIGGILVGELSHVATIAMSRHGFRWYEIAIICVINPAYAINNKFMFNKEIKVP